jgi:hypothetical protein
MGPAIRPSTKVQSRSFKYLTVMSDIRTLSKNTISNAPPTAEDSKISVCADHYTIIYYDNGTHGHIDLLSLSYYDTEQVSVPATLGLHSRGKQFKA